MKLSIILFFMSLSLLSNAQLPVVKSGVYVWNELLKREGGQRLSRKIMEGSSPHFEFLEIHATTQSKGAKPFPPHTQKNIEEILIVKEGLMKMTMDGESKELPAGSVILIPPLVEQSLENIGDGPLTYYVMMFKAKKPMNLERSTKAGGKMFLNSNDLVFEKTERGGRIPYFERPTAMCEKFEMHVTQLNEKGPSHKPHSHLDTEIILVIEGETEMTIDGKAYLGKAGDLYLMKSNEMHGISNIGEDAAKYFAFRWY
jgi:quercetin dioxygenase-like cupin family protein